jgi:hypothetical protein
MIAKFPKGTVKLPKLPVKPPVVVNPVKPPIVINPVKPPTGGIRPDDWCGTKPRPLPFPKPKLPIAIALPPRPIGNPISPVIKNFAKFG